MTLLKNAGVDLSQPETVQATVDQLDKLVTRLETEVGLPWACRRALRASLAENAGNAERSKTNYSKIFESKVFEQFALSAFLRVSA